MTTTKKNAKKSKVAATDKTAPGADTAKGKTPKRKNISKTNSKAHLDRVADLAVKLASVELANLRKSTPNQRRQGIADATYDHVFRDAMRRAEWMLSYPAQDDSIVWAEQLFFDSEDTMSVEGMRAVFYEWKWPNLTGRKSILALIDNVEKWLARHLELKRETLSNRFGAAGDAEVAFCSALLDFCARKTGSIMHGPWPVCIQWAATEIIRLVHNQCQDSREKSESFEVSCGETVMTYELVKWCLGGRDPQCVHEKSSKQYRPWQLFHFIRTCRDLSPELEAIREKLRVPRNKLRSDGIPHESLDDFVETKFEDTFFKLDSSNTPIQVAQAIKDEARSNHDNDPLITPHAALALGATPPTS